MRTPQHSWPTAFSVAGFKALPFDNPPVMSLEGVVVLMGTNSSGKSSLLLALRLLVGSVLQEPRLERLHLRLPGLPQLRLTSSIDLVDEARLVAHMAHVSAATGQPGPRELTFRIGFSDRSILECRFALPKPPPRLGGGGAQPDAGKSTGASCVAAFYAASGLLAEPTTAVHRRSLRSPGSLERDPPSRAH